VEIPAYKVICTNKPLSARILEIFIRGVSTRNCNYKAVVPEIAETVSVSKSAMSRRFVEASENATAAKSLLEHLVEGGVNSERRPLFVIDGSRGLRAAVDAVLGEHNPVQRCRSHKIRNVTDHVPRHMRAQVKAVLRAVYRLDPEEGKARLGALERCCERSWCEFPCDRVSIALPEGMP